MEEMNAAKNINDLGKLYLLTTYLVRIYLTFYELHTGKFLIEEDKEDFASDMAFYMIYEKEVHKKARFKYFWWSYISRTAWFRLTQAEDADNLSKVLKSFGENPFARTNRDFYRLTDARLNVLILNVGLLDTLDQVKQELGNNSYVVDLVRTKLKSKSTDDLLKLYKKLSKTYTADFKSCRTKLNELFYRKPPRKR